MAAQKKPRIFVNFKTYREGSGPHAERMAKRLSGKNVVLAVQNADIFRIAKAVRAPVFGQHVDAAGYGQYTGKDTASTLKYNGASGVLINHSEDRMKISQIKEAIKQCKKAKITSLVCAETPSEAASIARLHPDIIAIEPPELIGTGISVSGAKPYVVTKAVAAVKKVSRKIPVLCGAGITTGDDVSKSIKLGCSGVLVASAVMKARKPNNIIKQFTKALK